MKKFIPTAIILLIPVILIFKTWFTFSLISGGDLWYLFPSQILSKSFHLFAWDQSQSNGLGGPTEPFLWLYLSSNLPLVIITKIFGPNFIFIEKFAYFYPFLLIGFLSMYVLSKKIFSNSYTSLFSGFFYLTNTYALMMVGGGQMIIALSYAFAPFIIYRFIKLFEELDDHKNIKKSLSQILITGLSFATLVVLDIRVGYLAIGLTIFYLLFILLSKSRNESKFDKNYFVRTLVSFFATVIIIFLLNSFWILPTLFLGKNPTGSLGRAYTSNNSVSFFSFAKLEQTISLLHPNWPENIFGKVGFMKPEFLLIPIFAYASLLFVNKNDKKEKTVIVFFSILGLIGAFLAKGAQDPFGGIYIWLFQHVPGFVLFRDPTKWYSWIAISYSILIPFAVSKIYYLLKSHSEFSFAKQFFSKSKILNFQNLFLLLVIFYLLLLIKPALLGRLNGTFQSSVIPSDYVKFGDALSSDKTFYRTLWVPQIQRFALFTNNHPAGSANDLFKKTTPEEDIKILKTKSAQTFLQNLSFKYIVVPFDSSGEIFLTDRSYDDTKRNKTISDLESISFLKETKVYGKIAIFEIPSPKDHFWSPQGSVKINYNYINPSNYQLSIMNANKEDRVIFSESYDKNWTAQMQNSDVKIKSIKSKNGLNRFVLPRSGNYTLNVYYDLQKWVDVGSVISVSAFFVIILSLIYFKIK